MIYLPPSLYPSFFNSPFRSYLSGGKEKYENNINPKYIKISPIVNSIKGPCYQHYTSNTMYIFVDL